MTATYQPIAPITRQRDVFPQPISALSFDPVSDSIWAGLNSGQVAAFHTGQGLRGAAFPVGGHLPVKKIVVGETYVRALGVTGEGVGQWAKGGMNKWYHRSTATLTTFSNATSSSQNLCAATTSPELLLLNGVTGTLIRQASTPSLIEHLQYSHTVLLSGSADGCLRTHDPRTGLRRDGGVESVALAHAGGVSGMQVSGNYVYTIGWTHRQGRPFPDPLVRIFDMRQFKSLAPIPFQLGPAFINVLPRRQSSLVVTSHEGIVNIVDTNNPGATEFYQVQAYVSSVAVSPTGAYIALGDADGTIHLMSASNEEDTAPFNGYAGKEIEWADSPAQVPEIHWTDSTPLNSIGLPYYKERLLSSWTKHFVPTGVLFPAPPKIPLQVLNSMKRVDSVGYAALPKELRGKRNVVAAPKKVQGRFRSVAMQRHESENDPLGTVSPIPKCYRRLEIEYSKFGVEDFDFAFYNKTKYSGLETHILNCYTNPVLQAMHYLMPMRQLAKSHIATDCPLEHCLLCELGFVVRNLEDAKGTNCHAGNFCKTLGILAQASNAMELVDYGRESPEVNYAHMIQAFNRFLVNRLVKEWGTYTRQPRLVTHLLGVVAKTVVTCAICKTARAKEHLTHVLDLIYPRTPVSDFATLLHHSILREVAHRATCHACKRTGPFESRRSVAARDLPPILTINVCINHEDHMKQWLDGRKSTFLSPTVQVKGHVDGGEDEAVNYEVRAIVAQIVSDQQKHLVAIVRVPDAERGADTDPAASPWFVFNDFGVRNVSEKEALSFPDFWKVPAIVYLERLDATTQLDFSHLPSKIDEQVLRRDTNIAIHRDPARIKHELLDADELPGPGTLVAIDAEFVLMQNEETEFRSDGSKKVLRPARLSLARVSVLRGGTHRQGVPFIDDHIHTSEAIVDLLTAYSGIQHGDLDPAFSTHTLTPLKTVYKKLRLLVDRGCMFIGHGLSKDFRTINIFVPPEQVLDTVDIYFLAERQRRLSLRFLAWLVLGETIQQETHDSIEDARTALALWHAYLKFEEDGAWDQKLAELYREGKRTNFKPPQPDPAPTPAPAAAAAAAAVASSLGPPTPQASLHQPPPAAPSPPQLQQQHALHAPGAQMPPFSLLYPQFLHPVAAPRQPPPPFGAHVAAVQPQQAFFPQHPPGHYEAQTNWRTRR